jgi:hypothetical protein
MVILLVPIPRFADLAQVEIGIHVCISPVAAPCPPFDAAEIQPAFINSLFPQETSQRLYLDFTETAAHGFFLLCVNGEICI